MPSPKQNHLLAALSAADLKRMRPQLQPVDMPLGDVVYESGRHLDHVYFPTDCIVSLLYVLESGSSAEIAVVGNEGVVGVSIFMGGETTPSRAVVQSAGSAYRLPGQVIKDEFIRGGAMQHLMLRYTQALITQMAQTAVCNRHHSVDQQLCRWLLLSIDRLAVARDHDDTGADRQHARGSARGRHRGRREAAEGRGHQLPARTHQGAEPTEAGGDVVRVLRGRAPRDARGCFRSWPPIEDLPLRCVR